MSLPALKYAHGASHSLPLLLVVLRSVVVEHFALHPFSPPPNLYPSREFLAIAIWRPTSEV